MDAIELLRVTLIAVVMPLWMLAGLADWECHRRTHIQTTGGVVESNFHLLLYATVAVAGLAALTLEITTGLLVALLFLWLLHELATWLELRYVVRRRQIRPIEQMVHGFLEVLPLSGLLILAVLHHEQALALFNWADADWSFRSKTEPVPFDVLAALVGATVLLNVVPLLEENLRCRRMAMPLRRARFALR